jgi:AbrB family looped-hinge helix DNA binding protein
MTSKGQLTIPAQFRQELGLRPGEKIAVSLVDGVISIGNQPTIDELRPLIREQMRERGTLGIPYKNGDGWEAHVKERYARES